MRGDVLHGHYISSQRGAKLVTGKILTLLFEDYSPIFINVITFQSSITILFSSPTPKAFSLPDDVIWMFQQITELALY